MGNHGGSECAKDQISEIKCQKASGSKIRLQYSIASSYKVVSSMTRIPERFVSWKAVCPFGFVAGWTASELSDLVVVAFLKYVNEVNTSRKQRNEATYLPTCHPYLGYNLHRHGSWHASIQGKGFKDAITQLAALRVSCHWLWSFRDQTSSPSRTEVL